METSEIKIVFFLHILLPSTLIKIKQSLQTFFYFISNEQLNLFFLLNLLKEGPELLERDLSIPVLVQLVHQGCQLLLTHTSTQLAELTGIYRARVVLINSLLMVYRLYNYDYIQHTLKASSALSRLNTLPLLPLMLNSFTAGDLFAN